MLLALREAVESRPVRTVRALFLRAKDAAPKVLETLGRAPSRGREERVRGLDGAVTIARDAFGVPGVFGGSLADVAFGMGYACAEDRLFQMDLMRVALRGELASVLGARPVDDALPFRLPRGATLVDLDAFTRALGFRGAAEASYAIASAEARAWLDAYAAGVNAFVATGRRPLESLLLDLEPGPFTAVDSLLIGKGVAFQLGFAWRFALTYARIAGVVSADKLRALLPTHPLTVTAGAADAIEPVLLHARMLADVLGTEGLHLGSNAFALAAHRTSIGRPIVASDPHMPLHAPAVLWEVRLRGGGIDARGATIPGVPGLPIGQNAHAAWGMTAGWGDDSQVWREDLGALRKAGRLEVTHETIAVRGGDSRTVPVVRTPRGPIVSGATGDEQAIALRWCGDTASLETDGSLALLRARDFDDLRAAARLHSAPTLNFVFADREGHLGWCWAGRVARRPDPGVTSLDLLDGEDPRGQWVGVIPAHELPFSRDPADGVIVSANTRPHGEGYPHTLGDIFEPPFRYARIRALIDAHRGPLTLADIARIQTDVRASWATSVRDALLEGLPAGDLGLPERRGREVLRRMRTWDGRADETSVGASCTYAFLDAFVRHLLLDELGDDTFERYFELMNAAALPLLSAVRDPASPWLVGHDRATLVRDACAMAEGRLRRQRGEDPGRWRWGDLHTVTFRHPMAAVPGLRAASSPGPFPGRGDGTTVNMGEFELRGRFGVRVGPVLRFAMIAGAPGASRAVVAPGQSGDPASRHYRDQVGLYLEGRDRAASWEETDFSASRLRLVPG